MSSCLSTTDQAIVAAAAKGYMVLEDGSVLAPRGNLRALLTKRHRGGAYQSFTYVLGSRPSRKTVNIPVHRFAGYLIYGDLAFEPGFKVFHANNESLDNRPDNIVLGTPEEVMMVRSEEVRKRIAGTPHRRGGPRKLKGASA